MKNNKNLLYPLIAIFFFIFFHSSASLRATEPDFFFSHLGVENGLSQVSVLKIYQDADGFLWFGTRNGLNRYDGYEFKVYRNEVNNPRSLSDNYITDITEDNHQNLWVGTTNGLNCIDVSTGEVTRSYPQDLSAGKNNSIRKLLASSDGNLYAFTYSAAFRCNLKTRKLEEHIPLRGLASVISSVVQDADGNTWIATQTDGIHVYTPEWNELRHYREEAPKDITVLHFDRYRQLWAGTENSGCYRLDTQSQTFICFNESNSGLSNNYIRTFCDYGADTVLIGTFSGINLFDKKTGTVSLVKTSPNGTGQLSHFSVHSLFVDKDQTLWAGTYSAGVNYSSPYYKRVSFIQPENFTGVLGMGREDGRGNLWFATEGAGLLCYNPLNGKQTLYPLKQPYTQHFEANILKAILIQGDSVLCATHFGSVYLFSIRTKQYTLLYDFKRNDIYSLYSDSGGYLWIPTFTSDSLVMAGKEGIRSEFRVNGAWRKFGSVTVINEIRPGVFLFGTLNNGIYLYNRNEETGRLITAAELGLPAHERIGSITGIVTDSLQNIYISSSKSGIWRFNATMKLEKHYQRRDGIADSYISTIVLDTKGSLWALTGNKLYRLERETDSFSAVEADNLPLQEYSLYAGTVSREGKVYFPGNSGIVTFNPYELKVNRNVPKVYLTALHIHNRLDTLGNTFSFSTLPLTRKNEVVLQPGQSNLTIAYTGVSFVHSNQNCYAYKLDGVDRGWIFAGNRREAYYSNLDPGKYVFRVKACNSDGIWNPEETLLYLTVKPPLWKTWWAFLFYIATATALIYRFIAFRITKRELENDLRFKQMEKEKIEEIHTERMRLFTNFSHELRTPLTLIINPLEDLLQQFSFSTEVRNALLMMKKNTGRLLLLVNNLMDIQKYEAGKTILQKSRFDFAAFLDEIGASFESMAVNRNIRFEIRRELPEHFYVNYDREEIDKVFFNLLSNAFKFTPAGGGIVLTARQLANEKCRLLPGLPESRTAVLVEENYLYVEIADTGKGIESKLADKIFEPFYRSDEDMHKQIAGSGIGLSLTRSIVLQHNGFIWTESSPETGTRMRFVLPDTEKQPEIGLLPEEIPAGEHPETSRKVALLMEEAESVARNVILIADDNEEVLAYLEQQLQNEFVIRKAHTGREALESIENTFPDLVISDVMMPEMNGIEFCRKIKENIHFCHIPVILLTAKSLVSQIEEGWGVGADDYIVKPFHVSLLRARIRNLLATRKKMKEIYGDRLSLKSLGVEAVQPDEQFLHQYMEIVKENISNPDFDVAVIYQAIGMSRANFYRKVKAVTGVSPIELIKNIRLEAGARLLEETGLNITEIARQTGFGSGSYFARNFKAVYGISPTEYQEKKQKEKGNRK